MSGTMYSSLRYLLPEQARGEAWSSRLVKMEIRGCCGFDAGDAGDGDERAGSGWIGEGVG